MTILTPWWDKPVAVLRNGYGNGYGGDGNGYGGDGDGSGYGSGYGNSYGNGDGYGDGYGYGSSKKPSFTPCVITQLAINEKIV